MADEEKKIIVDDDWKKQAQKEKEELKKEEKKEQPSGGGEKKHEELPRGDFAALVSMLTTQAFFALGLLQVEGQDKKDPDTEMARYNIDMLQTLEEKTKGNLSDEEEKIVENTLSQLRMAFVQVAGK